MRIQANRSATRFFRALDNGQFAIERRFFESYVLFFFYLSILYFYLSMYISGFYWKESSPVEVTSQLVNGYISRAISEFCEMLSSNSFSVPDFQSRKTQIHQFTYHTSRYTTVRLLVHLFRSADTVRCFKLELDLCSDPTPGMLNLFFFPFFVILI